MGVYIRLHHIDVQFELPARDIHFGSTRQTDCPRNCELEVDGNAEFSDNGRLHLGLIHLLVMEVFPGLHFLHQLPSSYNENLLQWTRV